MESGAHADVVSAIQKLSMHEEPQERREEDSWRELDAFRLLAEDQYTECKDEIHQL